MNTEISKPWIEKYVPQTLDNIVGNQDIILRLKNILYEGNIILLHKFNNSKKFSTFFLSYFLLLKL